MKNERKQSFFKRIRVQYKLSVLNESTLGEVYHLRLSVLRLFGLFVLVLVAVLAVYSLLILYTPLRRLLPENVNPALRSRVVEDAIRVDSLSQRVAQNQVYLDAVKDVIAGTTPIDTAFQWNDSTVREHHAQWIEKSKKERRFCAQFEEKERFNLITEEPALDEMLFFPPAQGILTQTYSKELPGIGLVTTKGAPMSAVYQGVVLSAGYNPMEGYYIEILHNRGYISVYRGASVVFKKSGDVVRTGEVVGLVGTDNVEGKPLLHFELWHDMQPQDPTRYILMK